MEGEGLRCHHCPLSSGLGVGKLSVTAELWVRSSAGVLGWWPRKGSLLGFGCQQWKHEGASFTLVRISRPLKCNCRSALCVIFGMCTTLGNVYSKKQLPNFEVAYPLAQVIIEGTGTWWVSGLVWFSSLMVPSKHSVSGYLSPLPFVVCVYQKTRFSRWQHHCNGSKHHS